MYRVWLGRFFGFLFVFFLVTPGWLPAELPSKMVLSAPLLLVVVVVALGFIAFAWFIRRCFGLFVVEKLFFLFVVYMVLRDCIVLITVGFSGDYSGACMMRYVIFVILLVYCNLLFTTNYDRRSFFNSVYVFGTFFFIVSIVSGTHLLMGYVLFSKPPLLLIVFCIFGLISRKLNYLACFSQVAGVLQLSLGCHYKRSPFIVGVFSIVVFVCCFLRKSSEKVWFRIAVLCLIILYTVFQVQRWDYYGVTLKNARYITRERKIYNKINTENYFNRNLCDKVFGKGDRPENRYPHNVYLALLFSGGLVGFILWSSAFVFVAVLFFKFHGKCFVDFILWSVLGIFLLHSCYIGFFLYPTVIYFIVYYMEYRYRGMYSLRESS